ncbi:MAG: RIP metalloprotease RseP [Acidobacteria bacterium]|nr:RIP metalloprotease RseP [Acidobacteriota bacterium]
MSWLNSIGGVIIILGIMVFIHEWGHFIAARFFGIRVEIFSFGMGPRIWGRKRGDTDYRLSALPLGGYVKMAGDDPSQEREGKDDEFLSKPKWQRSIVILAGPIMNLVLAVLIMTGVFMLGSRQPIYFDEPVVLSGVIKGSPAEKSGLRAEDRIAEINRVANPTWNQLAFELSAAGGATLEMVVERKGERIPIPVPTASLKSPSQMWSFIGLPKDQVLVASITPGKAAEQSGMKVGDRLVSVNGSAIDHLELLRAKLQEVGAVPIDLLVQRGDQQLHLNVTPYYADPGDGGGSRFQLGFGPTGASIKKEVGLVTAFQNSVVFNYQFASKILWLVSQVVTGKLSIKLFGGPLEIARQSGQAVSQGPLDFLLLMASVSVNLGVINLLPIPILDGGHILMILVEGALRRELSVTAKERFVQVGMVFLLFVFVVVMYNDVVKILPGH